MASVAESGNLASLQLRDEQSALEAVFVPAAGMLCCSLRHRGDELLAQRRGVAAYAEQGKTMGIPLLYPWANRLAGFEYGVDGRTVEVPHDPRRVAVDDNGLPIHGVIGGRISWEPDPAAASGGQSLAASLSWEEGHRELFELFPFRHDLRYSARLGDGGLEVTIEVHACGADAVPLSFGFHPYFCLPGVRREDWLIELPDMRRLELDDSQIPIRAGEPLPAARFELGRHEFDDAFAEVPERARFVAEAEGRRIEVTFLEGYPFAQVFAPPGSEFICFEPMTAPGNALRSGVDLRLLPPGERFRASFIVQVSALA
jgi:galactose mutarotase-like enzyme